MKSGLVFRFGESSQEVEPRSSPPANVYKPSVPLDSEGHVHQRWSCKTLMSSMNENNLTDGGRLEVR